MEHVSLIIIALIIFGNYEILTIWYYFDVFISRIDSFCKYFRGLS